MENLTFMAVFTFAVRVKKEDLSGTSDFISLQKYAVKSADEVDSSLMIVSDDGMEIYDVDRMKASLDKLEEMHARQHQELSQQFKGN